MIRHFVLFAFLSTALFACHSQDHPVADLFGGYQRSSFADGVLTTATGNGWNAGGAFYFSQWLGVKGEVSGTYATDPLPTKARSISTYTYAFGPVLTVRINHRINPFGEVLFGSYHETLKGAPASYNGFALLAGGGFDLNLNARWSVRFGPFDLQHFQAPGNVLRWTPNTARFGGGLVFHL